MDGEPVTGRETGPETLTLSGRSRFRALTRFRLRVVRVFLWLRCAGKLELEALVPTEGKEEVPRLGLHSRGREVLPIVEVEEAGDVVRGLDFEGRLPVASDAGDARAESAIKEIHFRRGVKRRLDLGLLEVDRFKDIEEPVFVVPEVVAQLLAENETFSDKGGVRPEEVCRFEFTVNAEEEAPPSGAPERGIVTGIDGKIASGGRFNGGGEVQGKDITTARQVSVDRAQPHAELFGGL